jgi:hypothetical protein
MGPTMQCPYCAEKIKSEAVVCAHCGHDVGVVKPLMLRMVALEDRVRELSRSRARPAHPARRSWMIPAFGVAAGLLWTATAYLAGNPPEAWPRNLPYLLLSLLPPAVFGLGTGAVWRSGSWLLNLGAGLVLGLVDLVATLAVLSGVGTLVFNWPWALAVFNVGQPAIFATACWIGETASASLPLTRPTLKALATNLRLLWALALQALAQVATAFAHIRLIQEGL